MKKILISIHSDYLKFSYKNHQKLREDLINTNIISENELLFSEDYILENKKIFTLFVKELCEMEKIDKIVCVNNKMADFLLDYLKDNQFVKQLLIKSDERVTFSICEKIAHHNYIQHFHCFSIPYFMMEHLDKANVKVHSRGEILYTSKFMIDNDITYYSKIYYKKMLIITTPMNQEDMEDFLAFCKINHYLKIIKLNRIYKKDLENIFQALISNEIKNVTIKLYNDYNTLENVEYLKKMNKKYQHHKIKCTIVYSKEYLMNNIFKQIILNTLKICGFIISFLVTSVIIYVFTSNYIAMQKDIVTNDLIKEAMEKNSDNPVKEIEDPKTEEKWIIKNNQIANLLTINPDVVGYLNVKNTNIQYPVVQSTDNSYYLTHNLKNEKDKNGYIFMDYRNSDKILDDNTIIYGHNMYYSGVMFGQLHYVVNPTWYNNPDNLIISFDTMYETMNWQIFSIYKTEVTTDYLATSFNNDESYTSFVNMIKGRSIKNFNVDVNPGDKILTLSTCTGENRRLVIHAKLINNES